MTIRTIFLMWVSAFGGALIASGWWAVAIFTFPPQKEHEVAWEGLLKVPLILLSVAAVIALIVTICKTIQDGDK